MAKEPHALLVGLVQGDRAGDLAAAALVRHGVFITWVGLVRLEALVARDRHPDGEHLVGAAEELAVRLVKLGERHARSRHRVVELAGKRKNVVDRTDVFQVGLQAEAVDELMAGPHEGLVQGLDAIYGVIAYLHWLSSLLENSDEAEH